ncbi:AAA family ATPase [Enterococcus sp. JM9B]|uniref:AAA family ATPase n=1 Tax=Enterococcus sp. JM9B TaxID=1857216 RepID=UPI001374E927|nr:MoxR family ATPase [Enterococcus sp. JM9B]KAF1301808.1 AAA family ATPase [Enterococcus sp. JM9B]
MEKSFKHAEAKINELMAVLEQNILGKPEILRLTITALLADGHVLFEDVPGVGKTLLAKTLTQAIQADFKRIQFTPDLLPSDLLGVSIFNRQTNQFEFHQGPIFTTILLADELNRTTPRTQAALLEAMSEKQVTIESTSMPLNPHFFVIATQNPLENEGTYPLPEAQLDRFLFRLKLGYPAANFELQMLAGTTATRTVAPVLSLEQLTVLKQNVQQVHVAPELLHYALQLIQATRVHPELILGISPRAGVAFIQAAKAYALTWGRSYVIPDDLQAVVPAVFHHRLILKDFSQKQVDQIIHEIIAQTPVPVR